MCNFLSIYFAIFSLFFNSANGFTLAIFAVVMGFVMTSCNNVSPKETIMKSTDDFFTQAEEELNTIDNAEDFMTFFNVFEEDKQEFIQTAFADYVDEEGNIKGISDSDMEEIQSYMYDRASAYNKVEAAKAAEFLTPLIEQYEAAVDALYEAVSTGQPTDGLVEQFEAAENGLALFGDYDNVLPELQERAQAAEAKLDEVIAAMLEE